MKKTFCDRCGVNILDHEAVFVLTITGPINFGPPMLPSKEDREVDLCKMCFDIIKAELTI